MKFIKNIIYFCLGILAVSCTQMISQTSQENPPSLPANPTRIVALEWVYVEDLLALGIQPVGMADIGGFQQYVKIAPQLGENVVDVGTRQEPSLEAIAKLEPDLIIGIKMRHESIYNALASIAHTLLFDPYPPPTIRQLDEMEQTFWKIAEVVNAQAQGEVVWQQFAATFDKATRQIQSMGLAGSPFILGQFMAGLPQIRIFNDNAMAVQLLQAIGLNNAWQGDEDLFGFNTVWLESLPAVENANFFYITESSNPYYTGLRVNPIWQKLAFVKEKRIYPIGSDTWIFGGPLSAMTFVEKVLAALSASGL
ncbi:ABC transporter substrate-binding protein [[Phormidium] sp. ETS-05]|uniref:ABC transporter substrate-binding protein n=1 Tax=[Phormidium] sp. ETS-05 TaxID=222819 RepID=UPI0018EEDC95|nr:iron-siderophore ABC transporter substrate-binding protein [[Phormidium] sp. ETS-05]